MEAKWYHTRYSVMMEEATACQLLKCVRTQFTAMLTLWNRRLLEKMMWNNCLENNRDLSNDVVRWCEIVFLYTVISGARENLGLSSCTEDHREQFSCRCGFVFLHRRSKNHRNPIATVQATYRIAHGIISTLALAYHSVVLSSCNLL
jgi:hypothetical protein